MSRLRGQPIYFDGELWRYRDTGETTAGSWRERPCGRCKRMSTEEGHDSCLGSLPDVANACCGHGDDTEAYIQFNDGLIVTGEPLATLIAQLAAS